MSCIVLLVDTDVKVLHSFAHSLRAAGHLVFEASSYEEGKRLSREIPATVLVVDIRLGEFNAQTDGAQTRMWMDDIAIGTSGRIGCPPAADSPH